MSLLDINETESQLDEMKYLLYDEFIKYLEKHTPRELWDHSQDSGTEYYNTWKKVFYYKIIDTPNISSEIYNIENYNNIKYADPVYEPHTRIWITPTDDGGMKVEMYKYSHFKFPIITTEKVPIGVMKVLEKYKDNVEIINGCLKSDILKSDNLK